MPDDDLDDFMYVNGVDPATGRYLVRPGPVGGYATALAPRPEDLHDPDVDEADEAARRRIEEIDAGFLAVTEGVDSSKLDEAGWGVVFSGRREHAEQVEAARAALGPLLEHRSGLAGRLFEVYDGGRGYQDRSAVGWLTRLHVGNGTADPEQMPYHLLIVGGPDQVPFDFQYRVDIQRSVGRICFDDPAGYRRYADAVVAHERGGIKATKRVELFGPRNPGDKATSLSMSRLVQPLERRLDTRPGWQVHSTIDGAATRDVLSALINHDDPALLLAASHGLGLAADDPLQRSRQGALVCADWEGLGKVVRPSDAFAAADVAQDADLSGRMAFLFACFGGGTPAVDEFAHRVDVAVPRKLADEAFASALPQALLSRGMLAVMAHVDRAWSCSFGSARADSTPTFASTLKRLMNGKPVGVAFDDFNVRTGELALDLAELLADVVARRRESYVPYCSTWTAATDARNYVVFGDPAVRLNT